MMNNNYNEGFYSLKNNAIIELPSHLLRTYSYLVSKDFRNEGVWHSQETLSKSLGISVRTIQRHIKALKELGYISARRRGFNQTNIYKMLKSVVSKVKETKEELISNFKKNFTNNAPTSNKLKFDNFTGRNYSKEDWNNIEKKLLGWE